MFEIPEFTAAQLDALQAGKRLADLVATTAVGHLPADFNPATDKPPIQHDDCLQFTTPGHVDRSATITTSDGHPIDLWNVDGYYGPSEPLPFHRQFVVSDLPEARFEPYRSLPITYAGGLCIMNAAHGSTEEYNIYRIEKPSDPLVHGLGLVAAFQTIQFNYSLPIEPGSDLAEIAELARERLIEDTARVNPELAREIQSKPLQASLPCMDSDRIGDGYLLDARATDELATALRVAFTVPDES